MPTYTPSQRRIGSDEVVGSVSLVLGDYISAPQNATFIVLGDDGSVVQGVEGPTILSLAFSPCSLPSPGAANPQVAASPAFATPAGAPPSHAGSSPLPSPTAFFDDGEDPALNLPAVNGGGPPTLAPEGGRAGVGVKCGVCEGRLRIKAVMEGSPSERGGVRPGDVIDQVRMIPCFTARGLAVAFRGGEWPGDASSAAAREGLAPGLR